MKLHHWGRKAPARKPFNWTIYTALYSGTAGFMMLIIAVALIR